MAKKGYSFGTFQGVFVPSILTILGVIMYLRFGWVLGNVGLVSTILIVTIATSITFLTSLSLAALVTNSPVGGGGAYYIISRSLGIEAGSAIGLPLYCAQTLGVSFYISGFAESVNLMFPSINVKLIAIVTLAVVALLVFFSANIALKSQYIILTLITFSLIAFFFGNGDRLPPPPDDFIVKTLPFWTVFAVFFPAVTGIEAGLGMSGDLKNPAKSLTWGTLGAVLFSYCVYLAIPLFINKYVPDKAMLLSNNLIMADIARWKWAVIAGLWGATLSSAIGSLLTAPRTLQAISTDRIVPFFIGRGFGKNNDPRIATVLSFCIGLGGILLGDLNVLAPILSMFFLTSYGLINVSAAFEGIIGSPWWRPTFKTHWIVSVAGSFGCFAAMFMIDSGASFIALFLAGSFYFITRHRRLKAHWGDARSGILMWLVQQVVYKLTNAQSEERTWRPNILVFAGSPSTRWYLISLADALTRGRGIMTTASIVPFDTKPERIQSMSTTIHTYLEKRKIKSLIKIHASKNVADGACDLIQSYGFGPIFPNTILLGDPSDENPIASYVDILYTAITYERNIIIVKETSTDDPEEVKKKKTRRIDVWWDQESENAGLLLAIAFLMRSSPNWNHEPLAVHVILTADTDEPDVKARINKTVGKMRLHADIVVHENRDKKSHFDIITAVSVDADFVLLGLHPPKQTTEKDAYQRYFEGLIDKIDPLPATGLVMAQEELDFDQLFIE